jgi:hypothetical protein
MGKERPKHVELPKKKTKQSDIKLFTDRYCNTMHGTMNLKYQMPFLERLLKMSK